MSRRNETTANKRSSSTAAAYHSERVIVLGAGMAGLACARELQHRGYKVLVVEARGRAGGRLKGGTVKVPSRDTIAPPSRSGSGHRKQPSRAGEQVMDLGGALIHGVDDNPLTSLVQDMGVATQPVQECLLFQNGWPIDPRVDAKISASFNDCLEEAFARCGGPDNGASFGELFREVCSERSTDASSPVFLWHKANLEVSCGASFDELGCRWNEDEPYGYDGDHAAVRRSWKAVVDGLAEDLDVLYDSPVKRVHVVHPAPQLPEPRVPPPAASSKAGASSELTPGSSNPAKRKRATFDTPSTSAPVRPPRKSRRLMHLDADARRSSRANLGQMVERFTVASRPFSRGSAGSRWGAPRRGATAPPRREEAAVLRPKRQTVVQIELENGRVLEADFVVCTLPLAILQSGMVAFDPPLPPAKQQAVQKLGAGLLNKCVLSFPRVFWQESDFMGLAGEDDEDTPYLILNGHSYLNQPVLAFLFGGSDASRIESLTDREIVEECMDVLKRICGRQIPDPLDYRVSRWGREQYSRMAFTYVPPGVDGFRELRVMGEAIHDHTGTRPSLMFAGEHTTPYHPSTIHGAFLSGIREAYRLDLSLYPQANEGMSFSESELYQRTFAVRRQYSDTRRAPAKGQTGAKDPQNLRAADTDRKQHRRRGAAGVMKLRKRPSPSKLSAVANGAPVSPPFSNSHRKSPRAVAPPQMTLGAAFDQKNGSLTSPTSARSNVDPLQHQRHIAELEESTLLRGIESFGNDPEYLLEMLLPVHGADLRPGTAASLTLAQLKKRCQQLTPVLRNSRATSATTWKRWVAKIVYPPAPASSRGSHKQMRKLPVTTAPSPRQIRAAGSKPTVVRSAPTCGLKSRAGRVVRKPSLLSMASGSEVLSPVGSKEAQERTSSLPRQGGKRGSVSSTKTAAFPSIITRFGRLVKRQEGSQ